MNLYKVIAYIVQEVSSLRSLTPLQFIPHRVNRKGTLLHCIYHKCIYRHKPVRMLVLTNVTGKGRL